MYCPTGYQSAQSLQKRALRIIYSDMDYHTLLFLAELDTLYSRREILTQRFYRAMLCIRGTGHGPVSVRPSVRHKSVFY